MYVHMTFHRGIYTVIVLIQCSKIHTSYFFCAWWQLCYFLLKLYSQQLRVHSLKWVYNIISLIRKWPQLFQCHNLLDENRWTLHDMLKRPRGGTDSFAEVTPVAVFGPQRANGVVRCWWWPLNQRHLEKHPIWMNSILESLFIPRQKYN